MAQPREIEKLQRRWQENPLGLTFAPLAEAYRKEAMYAEALELLDLGLGQHPNYVPALIVQGRCHLDTGADAAAQAAFLRVADLDPENVIALKGLAEIAERAGRFHDAASRLERLLAFDRNNDEARALLERVRAMLATPSPGLVELEPAAPPIPEPPPTLGVPLHVAEVLDTVVGQADIITYDPVELTAAGAEHLESRSEGAPSVSLGGRGTPDEPSPVHLAETGVEADASAPDEELVITETMAELFLRQGHRELALAVYGQLVQRDPENLRIRETVDRLSADLQPPPEAPPPPAYAAAVTGGRSVRGFFHDLLSARPPPAAPTVGPSLSAVFGDAPAMPAPPPEPEPGPSYDEFFAAAPAGSAPPPAPTESLPTSGSPAVPEDIEEFNTWLRGLKR
jgi:tetratricopeptide (TPR) repeat protein